MDSRDSPAPSLQPEEKVLEPSSSTQPTLARALDECLDLALEPDCLHLLLSGSRICKIGKHENKFDFFLGFLIQGRRFTVIDVFDKNSPEFQSHYPMLSLTVCTALLPVLLSTIRKGRFNAMLSVSSLHFIGGGEVEIYGIDLQGRSLPFLLYGSLSFGILCWENC